MIEAEKRTADNLIKAAKTDAYQRVFFLGPYARRVSFASQQNRALNLVWALHRTQSITLPAKIAVIGAGLSGITTSAALADLGYEVYVYETGRAALNRQMVTRHRYIHPTINQWPDAPLQSTTVLPYFDWMNGVCNELMVALNGEWKERLDQQGINFDPMVTVTGFHEYADISVMTATKSKFAEERYQAVIVTSGFSDEKLPSDGFFQSYWRDEHLESDILSGRTRNYLVSGCGDGGLIDALRIAHKEFDIGRLVIDVANHLDNLRWPEAKLIREAEAAINQPPEINDAIKNGSKPLALAYGNAASKLPADIKKRLKASLHFDQPAFVTLFSRERNPFSPMTAPIHKLLIAHAMDAGVVKHIQGHVVEFLPHELTWVPLGQELLETSKQQRRTENGRVVVRHGASPNFEQFLKHHPGAVEDLTQKQKLLASDFDRPIWAEGNVCLKKWPPQSPYDPSDLRRRAKQARKVLGVIDDVNAFLDPDQKSGFVVEYQQLPKRNGETTEDCLTRTRARVATLPSTLFGFPLVSVLDKEREPEQSTPYGSEVSIDQSHMTVIAPGAPIISRLNGRLGPILEDESGNVLALTAAHVLFGTGVAEPMPVMDSRGALIGHNKIEPDATHSDENNIVNIGAIELTAVNLVGSAYGPFPFIKPPEPDVEKFGLSVIHIDRHGVARRGYVSSSRAVVSYRVGMSDDEIIVRNVLRVSSTDKRKSFASAGDSGAPVVSNDGTLIGLVLSGNSHSTYVLDVDGYLQMRKLTPISRGITVERTEEAALPLELAQVAAGLAKCYRQLLEEEPTELGGIPKEPE